MTFQRRFVDVNGAIFTVEEVIQTPVGLTVYYHSVASGQKYSCLLDAFSQRFKEMK
jgi:hypothetical protein